MATHRQRNRIHIGTVLFKAIGNGQRPHLFIGNLKTGSALTPRICFQRQTAQNFGAEMKSAPTGEAAGAVISRSCWVKNRCSERFHCSFPELHLTSSRLCGDQKYRAYTT
ncbi:hypothetical protein [Ruegeria sp. HKCCD6119]|uniref:hypothetical protein n=1 Tax=Ruegeria sp. HKCCD6119 TaxID=2683003 RepID=UPI001490DFE8|nr:hypothetical protein [Ruegeria sp. HKCCD6119]NOD86363.1 hypothetical protein [Ruegeria sp. HKCCD6119]